jgi:hypothetical protein
MAVAAGLGHADAATRQKARSLFRDQSSPEVLRLLLDGLRRLRAQQKTELDKQAARGCVSIALGAVVWLAKVLLGYLTFFLFRRWTSEPIELFTGDDPPPLTTLADRIIEDVIEAAREVLSACGGASYVGGIARAVLEPKLRETALIQLVDIAPEVGSEDALKLTPAELDALTRLVTPGWVSGRPTDRIWRAVGAAVAVLAFTSHEPAIAPLRRLAEGQWRGSADRAKLRSAARKAATSIDERLAALREQATLLRASTATDDSATLLRPATAGEEPPEQLLRPERPEAG